MFELATQFLVGILNANAAADNNSNDNNSEM
jgi:hypothetical protein